jgi:hypothetical protein
MIKTVLCSILIVFTVIGNAQLLDFSEMDHVPEYIIGNAFLDGNNHEAYTHALINGFVSYSNRDNNFQNFFIDERRPFFFSELNQEDLVATNAIDYFLISIDGVEIIFSDSNNEGYNGYLHCLNNNIYISTNENVYVSQDRGESFNSIHVWNQDNRLIKAKIFNDYHFLLITDDLKFWIEQRDEDWNLINNYDLSFTPTDFVIIRDELYLSTNLGIYFGVVANEEFSFIEIESFGDRTSLNIHNDTIVGYEFNDKTIQVISTDLSHIENYALEDIGLRNNFFGNEFYLYDFLGTYWLKPIFLNPLQFDTNRLYHYH